MFKWTAGKRRFVFAILIIALSAIPIVSAKASIWLQVPAGSSYSGSSPVAVIWANGGTETYKCDDYWIVFYNVPQNKIMPTNKLRVSATYVFNQLHIQSHGGLTGFTECNSGSCVVHLCGKDGGVIYNGWSHRLEMLP